MTFLRFFLAVPLFVSAVSLAEPVTVRYPGGSVHGYLALRTLDGKLLAAGDLVQTIHGEQLTSHLVYRFKDGSIDDETAVFTQAGHFHLASDHHIQKGPSFPKPTDINIDTKTDEVTVSYMDDGKLKVDSSRMELPDDLSNGILIGLAQNLSPKTPATTISYLAVTPKPRIVHLVLTPDGMDAFRSAGRQSKAQRYRVHVELGCLSGMIAPLVGKEPADSIVWVGEGQVPAFIKSESPLYLGGPQLRTELVGPVWAQANSSSH